MSRVEVEGGWDAALEAGFQAELAERNRTALRYVSILSFTVFPLFGALDPFVLGAAGRSEFLAQFLMIRAVVGMLTLGVFLATFRAGSTRYATALGVADLGLLGLAIAIMIQYLGGYDSTYYAGLNILILTAGLFFLWTPWVMVLYSVSMFLAYLGPCLMAHLIGWRTIDSAGLADFINNNFFIATTAGFCVLANHFAHGLRRAQFKAARDLEQANEQLKTLDQMKSRFFANISHELRTPLTLILSPLDSILTRHAERLEGQLRSSIQSMRFHALRLLKLINDLLDLAKLDEGRVRLRVQEVELGELLRGVIDSVGPLAQRKRIAVEYEGPEAPVQVWIDPERIEQVVLNLLANAVKFTPDVGRITARIDERPDGFLVSIADTGIGISAEEQRRIFDRFAQADDSLTRARGGTGIGLSIAKELVELHGGRIEVESTPGEGTCFSFSLGKGEGAVPADARDRRSATQAVSRERRAAGSQVAPWTEALRTSEEYRLMDVGVASDRRVAARPSAPLPLDVPLLLLAEDDPDVTRLLTLELAHDYRVIAVPDGAAALEKARAERPDVIVSDVMMPKMSGYELCREVKQDPRTSHIPVLLLTAKGDVESKVEGLGRGADAYMAKPFNPAELLARIAGLLRQREGQSGRLHQAKMSSLATFAAGIAHEINNPLVLLSSGFKTLMMFYDELGEKAALDEGLDGQIRTFQRSVDAGIDRIEEVVRKIMRFSMRSGEQTGPVDLHKGIESTLELLRPELKDRVQVTLDLCQHGTVEASQEGVHEVLINLLLNASQAIDGEGSIWIQTREEPEGSVTLSIRDDGRGIPKDVLPRVFDHFFSTREEGEGMGLGLSIVHEIVNAVGGSVRVHSEEGAGTEFCVVFPRQARARDGR